MVEERFFVNELKTYNVDLTDPNGNVLYQNWHRNLDTGGIQKDVIYLDPWKTLESYYNTVHKNRQVLLENEVVWAREHSIHLILMDATQFGAAIAKELGIKSILVTNFTWDFIFQEMLKAVQSDLSKEQIEYYQEMIDQCSQDVLSVDHYLQYPGGTPLPRGFDHNKIVPGPLLTRQIRNKNLRNELGISSEKKILLLGFGGHSADWNLQDSFLPDGWVCLVLRADPKAMPSERFQVMPYDAYVPDLIHAADAVLGKIGYGFVSECLGGGTALIYIPRVYWPEEAYLENVLTNVYHAGVRLPLSEYNNGNWTPYIQDALNMKGSWTIEPDKHPDNATSVMVEHILRVSGL
jgi:L-arabinokinase